MTKCKKHWNHITEGNLPEEFMPLLIFVPQFSPYPRVREAYRAGTFFYIPALGERLGIDSGFAKDLQWRYMPGDTED